ncbi:E3 ubiquitin-protein ligase WAV3-like [Henckelia pumila]|uniref:E3 ubiquitin-protein ligase WAV3-like n=1 Tax=Henckelia pumila TaxID=405737 RepID=UPI003C6DC2E2
MSSPDNKTCGVCYGSLATGKGQAIFTAECSHSFHFGCITNNSNNLCPVCGIKWKDTPFTMPNSSASNTFFPSPFLPPQRQYPRLSRVLNQPQFPLRPVLESETFSDDDPLPGNVTDPNSLGLTTGLERVTIKAIPERPALGASESLSEFSVLVGLKAPSISDNGRNFQHAPIDLVTVLDVSGSMHGSKLSLMKSAVHFIIDNLGPSDRLSIVSFADTAQRILPLRRMIDEGRQSAKQAVDWLSARGSTNIVHALKIGVKVLEDRRQQNPVSTIIFLSDGNDTCNYGAFSNPRHELAYLHLLPASICPQNRGMENSGQQTTFPVHTFGFGTDHDPVVMHAIANASGGTFSFIESYEMLQDAFASCIGGLLSVVTQDLCLNLRSASHGVEIKSIPSGRYASETYNGGSQGIIKIGDLYADEEKEFLINLSVPSLPDDDAERKTSLLDIKCSYRDVASNEMVQIEGELVEIRRPKSVFPQDMVLNMEVDRQRNRLSALLTITEAQQMAETGNLAGAQAVLSKGRSELLATASAQAGDTLCMWLDGEIEETRKRMATPQVYMQQGRAYALSGMSSHTSQRAASRGNNVAGAQVSAASFGFGGASGGPSAKPAVFGAYVTPTMANMVAQSQQQSKLAKGISPTPK